jgi:hypothetical protein
MKLSFCHARRLRSSFAGWHQATPMVFGNHPLGFVASQIRHIGAISFFRRNRRVDINPRSASVWGVTKISAFVSKRHKGVAAIGGRFAIIGSILALGWWLWPDGFLFGPVRNLDIKALLLASASMSMLAVALLMMLFAAAETIAVLIRRLRPGCDRTFRSAASETETI